MVSHTPGGLTPTTALIGDGYSVHHPSFIVTYLA